MDPSIIREKAELVALRALPGLTDRRVREMLTLFGSPAGAWEAIRVGRAGTGAPDERFSQWSQLARKCDPGEELEVMEARGIHTIIRGEDGYPTLLFETHDAPLVLFYRGRLPGQESVGIAIVGSRKATPYGLEVARWLGREIARFGVNVVSGAAYGIDSAAHLGALEDGGFTTAVLGCGVDVAYPRSNSSLFRRIAQDGCILSEYLPGTGPLKQYFPARNRIIAGISQAVVVVEAAENSGALLTVDYALAEGREVFAVPGQIFSANSMGTNALIKSGAQMATRPSDILGEIGVEAGHGPERYPERPRQGGHVERRLFDVLAAGPCDVEELSREAGLNAAETISVLSRMEVGGVLARDTGGRYHLAVR